MLGEKGAPKPGLAQEDPSQNGLFNGETGLRLETSWHIFCKNMFVLQISLCQGRMDDSPHVIFHVISAC